MSKVIMFSGQGRPVIGMGKTIADTTQKTKDIWDCATDLSGIDIRKIAFKGPMPKLIETTNQQVIVTAINLSMFSMLEELKDDTIYLGHSVGEFSALYASGALSLEDTIKAVVYRSQIMHKISCECKAGMYVVKDLSKNELANILSCSEFSEKLDICCDNVNHQVIGGEIKDLKPFCNELRCQGYEVAKLDVSGAWHTKIMSRGCDELYDALKEVTINKPKYSLVMNVSGKEENNPEQIKTLISKHLISTVEWKSSLETCREKGGREFLELGNKKTFNSTCESCFSPFSDWNYKHFNDLKWEV
ncbi:ACP S-malonyltransferase [Thorsellia kenyensis]|uniref:[acyl-carrier-protein] S-malonyltransferase n=1 Tax=Thorsellia kenyensis TaxID=1549888 RepID=A0ABV6CBA8_9GAMM